MEFGVFDHLDRYDIPLHEYYEARLKLIELYDAAGFYAYHLAEHHATPLGMAPSPRVFLAAVAQRTRRLRFGPMVYALPLYHPLRLIEEICMLDQMSGGRLPIGIGPGAPPGGLALFRTGRQEGAGDLCRRARTGHQGHDREDVELRGRAFPLRRGPDGDRAIPEAAP